MTKLIVLIFLIFQSLGFAWGAEFEWDEAILPESLANLTSVQGLRVMWWNIHDGRPAAKPAPYLSRNLIQLIHSELAPQVIVFAEYRDSSLSPEALNEVNKAYPHTFKWSYPYSFGYGLVLYSKYPFQLSKLENMDVTPIANIQEPEQEQYRNFWCGSQLGCLRLFASFDINVNGKNIQLIAVHIFDVWRRYSAVNGKARTAQEIVFGNKNPLENQLIRFKGLLDEKLISPSGERPPSIIIGDFNIPKRLLGFQPLMYRGLKQNLVEVFQKNPISFPAKSADERGHYPKMLIDHAFLSGAIQSDAAKVLPLRGSDHYPLYMILNY